MTTGGAEISLRGDGAWGGLGDSSQMSPTPGRFSTLSGCYISKDGTEIRRAPGTRLAGTPYCGEPLPVIQTIQGTPTTLTLNPTYVNNDPKASASGYCYIYGHNEIEDGEYSYTAGAAANQIVVDVTTTVPGASGSVLLNRLNRVHGLGQAEGRTVVLCDTKIDGWGSGISTRYNIGTVVSPGPLDLDDPDGPGDSDDEFLMWPSPTMIDPTDNHWDDWGGFIPPSGRITSDTLNGIAVITYPGFGCLFHNNIRANERFQPWWTNIPDTVGANRYTKLLGVPKGLLAPVPVVASAGSSGFNAGDQIKVAVGYFDWVTGQVGLPSEVYTYTVQNPGDTLFIVGYTPRKVAPESIGLGVIIYASQVGGDALMPIGTGAPAIARNDEIDNTFSFPVSEPPADEDQTYPRYFPVTEQLPTGATLLAVSKGRLFYASPLPDYYQITASSKNASKPYKLIIQGDDSLSVAGNNAFSPLAYGRIPHSFAGHRIWKNDANSYAFGKITKGNIITGDATFDHGIEVDFDPQADQDPSIPELDNYLIQTQTDLIGYTEEGKPGVSPGLYNMEVDSILGTRPTGLSRVGDALLAMTERSTALFTWSSIPRKASSQIVSETVGCISGTSVIEYPGGVAWLSHEGPVAFSGGLQDIGKHVSEFFRSLADDGNGVMPAVTVALDTDRELVIWNLRTTGPAYWYEPAEVQLIWSYSTGQFSTVNLSRVARHPAIGTAFHSDGEWKPTEVTIHPTESREMRLWGWDDNAAEYAATVTESTATAPRTTGSNFDSTGIEANVTASEYGFVRSSNGEDIRWFGLVESVSIDLASLDSADGADWQAGDVLTTKVIPMQMETHYFKPAGLGFDQEIRGFVVRGTVTASHAYIRFRVEDEDGNVTIHSRGSWGERFRTGTTRFECGYASGSNLRILIDVIADGQVAIKDIGVEVTGSGAE